MPNLQYLNYIISLLKTIRWLTASLIFNCVCVLLTQPSLAQAPNPAGNPNQDRFPQPGTIPEPLLPQSEPPIQPAPTPTPEIPTSESSQTIRVEKIIVIGSTVFTAEKFKQITQPAEGRNVTIEELRKIADAITQLYLDIGYITSRAILVDQTVNNGVVEIRIIEGIVEKIEVQGTKRLNPEYVRSRLALGTGKPLLTSALEDQLRLLRADPLLSNVEASLRAGSGVGRSILIVRVTEAQNFNAFLGVDNYSPPSIGSERLGVNASYRNLSGNGDEIAASYYRTTQGGADIFDFNYLVPLNPMNGTLQLRTSFNNTNVVQEPFKSLDISGESQLYEISFRQPLLRTPREEFALSLGFTAQNGQTFTFAGATPFGFGPDEEGNSRTRVIKFGQDYVRRDVNGAWALRSLLSFGLGIFDATINSDPIPDGRFFSWLAQVQRVQSLSTDNILIAQAELQLTPNGLLPSQQFVVGGGQSVRGYRQNVRAGDNGVRFSLEDRLTVQRDVAGNATLQVAPFFDMAYIWNVDDNPNTLQRQKFIAGLGLGVLYQPLPQLDIRLDYGVPLVDLDDRGRNAQDDGFYFSVGYRL
ncbi:ShlB/FhaC/HecB family hemolysin secretion/activation protein [Nostoc sp. FACHB-152]|uniref:ShlB/FhaC/HecB family hemolysin secretion/activation protein n=1 Tax=unclassified Nostoc TaxID=2593658 RepID=UPI0016823F3D|nr:MULTISPECIES: ShlB/FhaC/HecB family hemolysin secretion/activation protein [unclassified Nostoc]MBD2447588.1 ShlB/FhaC/HecB family hemolysin secretion/activation protein [Nostoc sp. FACHB-152]MBD2469360.1 ShlB/FhaC/HecB family hemolysin secretion/activation protein [Nostoc sp. FACHB-145]